MVLGVYAWEEFVLWGDEGKCGYRGVEDASSSAPRPGDYFNYVEGHLVSFALDVVCPHTVTSLVSVPFSSLGIAEFACTTTPRGVRPRTSFLDVALGISSG